MSIETVVIYGRFPPPIGGVTKSIENLFSSLIYRKINVEVFTLKSLFKKYDVAHIHYSKSWKRLVGIMIGKVVANKVVFTIHGNKYHNDFLNRINSRLTDGVIFLNQQIYTLHHNKFDKSIILPSLFKEGLHIRNNYKKIIKKSPLKVYLLLYAYDKIYQDGKDIYGVDFILNTIKKLKKKYVVVFLDPKQGYKKDINRISKTKLIYLGFEVDFISLLHEIDIYIRPTSSDGNSVAIQEALAVGKNVLASDVVDRPNGVSVYKYNHFQDFSSKLEVIQNDIAQYYPDSIDRYLNFVSELK